MMTRFRFHKMWEEGKLFKCPQYHVIGNMKIYDPISEVYKAVVEFIKWHNQQSNAPVDYKGK